MPPARDCRSFALALTALLCLALAGAQPVADDNIWASFSRETNLFYRGAMLAGPAATADSDAACARACAQAPGCILWSFCPLEAAEGCEILGYCDLLTADAEALTVPAGTCLLTGDTPEGLQRTAAVSVAKGPAVAWSGGMWTPQQAQQEEVSVQVLSPGPDAAGGSQELSGRKLLARRRRRGAGLGNDSTAQLPAPASLRTALRGRALRQGGGAATLDISTASDDAALDASGNATGGAGSIWARFSREAGTFYRGPNLLASLVALSEEDCAASCGDDPACAVWAFCPPSQTDGCDVYDFCSPASSDPLLRTAVGGTCLLSADAQQPSRTAFVMHQGSAVAWSAGALSADAPADSPAAAPAPTDAPTDVSPSPPPPGEPVESPPAPAEPSSPAPPSGDCPAPGKMCGGLCINVQSDTMNCGFCGNRCWVQGQTCMGGICMCRAGQRQCGTTCANTLMDSSNCGSCGWSCGGRMCMMGVCS